MIVLIILDIISKKLIFQLIDVYSFKQITNFFDITHIHNFGVSFGLFSNLRLSWIFIIIGLLITGVVFYMLLNSKSLFEKWGFTLIIAGALSNILDRTMNGFVIDFLYFHYNNLYWPAFNFADIYISLGILIIVLQILYDLNKRFK